jgi:predicted O-linked N-acetylglucosamine transferase (SPINDLY family)
MEATMGLRFGQMSLGDVIAQSETLKSKGEINEAVRLYQNWITSSGTADRFVAMFNVGVLLADLRRDVEAETAYRGALELAPAFSQARINLGLLLERNGQHAEAIEQWRQVWDNRQDAADWLSSACVALNHTGRLHENNKNYEAAEEALYRSLQLNKKQSDAIQHWYHIRQRQCKWPSEDSAGLLTTNEVIASASPLATLAMTDDTAIQWLSAQNFVARKFALKQDHLANGPLTIREKIRIGYVSGDFCTHAVGLLMAELIESHNREKFEIFAFDFSPEDGSAQRDRLKKAFDYFLNVKDMSDSEVAILVRRCDIDVLVDMHGLSSGARPGIFALRPGRLQVAYLGYLGTTAMPWIDRVVIDRFCLTNTNETHFTEKPIVVEGSSVPVLTPSADLTPANKTDYGLPEGAIILGCFNNIYKFSAELCEIWSRILKKNSQAVLWLLNDNQWATENIKRYFSGQGVEERQLIFADRCTHAEYKRRLTAVDVYLDTFPYNAGSTAWDVLDANIPLVTLSGRSYMSRVAGSMLTSAGLSELVTTSKISYEKKIIAMLDERARQKINKKISRLRPKWPEVTKKLVQSMEVEYARILKNET